MNKSYAESLGAPSDYPGGDDAYQRSAMRVLEKIRDLVGVASVTVGPGWNHNDQDGKPLPEPVYVGFGVQAIGTHQVDGKARYVAFSAGDPAELERQPSLLETALRKVEYTLCNDRMQIAWSERSGYMAALGHVGRTNPATAVEQAFKAGFRAASGLGDVVTDRNFQETAPPSAAPTLLVPRR